MRKNIFAIFILTGLLTGCGTNFSPVLKITPPNMAPAIKPQVKTKVNPGKNVLESFKASVKEKPKTGDPAMFTIKIKKQD